MSPATRSGRPSAVIPAAGAAVLILALTWILMVLPVNALTAGMMYLVAILLVGASIGLAASLAASITATACLNYFFLPPVGAFTIADTQNWIALFAFLVTSLVASQLSDREKRQALEAGNKQSEMERLYALSRATMLTEGTQPVAKQIAAELARIYEIPSVALYDRSHDQVYCAGPEDIPGVHDLLRDAALTESTSQTDDVLITTVALGGHAIGSLALKRAPISDAALHALLNLVAINLENARSRELATRAEVARSSEQFKSILLDGLAHEFKTPLTSIKAATTSLLSSTVSDPGQREEMLTIIDEEADRLTSLVSEALHLARIEAGKIHLQKEHQSVETLIGDSIRQLEPEKNGRVVDVEIARDLPDIALDGELMLLALRQLLDNALKYSPKGSPIRIKALISNGMLSISVHNQGEPLSDSEQDRIFEKFYRGSRARDRVPGTGMGLAIAREIVQAHGGNIRVESSADLGTEFTATIPVSQKN